MYSIKRIPLAFLALLTLAIPAWALDAPVQALTTVVTVVPLHYPTSTAGSIIVTWAPVVGATSYVVRLGGRDHAVQGTTFQLKHTCGGGDTSNPSVTAIKSVAGQPTVQSAKTFFLNRKITGYHTVSKQCVVGPDPWPNNPITGGNWSVR